jgi:hypothetical protein
MNEILSLTLSEYLTGARLCLDYVKDETWPGHGCLGFPAALLLFSVTDAIGSYLRGSEETFLVDGVRKQIKRNDFQHFFVLNGESYYRQTLSHSEIKYLYDKYRSFLVHHAIFAPAGFLEMSASPELFPRQAGQLGVNLTAFYNRSIDVSERFIASHPELQLSQAAKNIFRGAV